MSSNIDGWLYSAAIGTLEYLRISDMRFPSHVSFFFADIKKVFSAAQDMNAAG